MTARGPLRMRLWQGAREASGAIRHELPAAAVVAVLLVPQSLAYALLAGLPAQVGLYASVLPLLAYALFGASPLLGFGPAAVLALMIAQALAQLLPGIAPEAAALVLAAQVGIALLLAAWLRLHALAALLSAPVLQGFEIGAALSIALSQLPVLLGSPARGADLIAVLQSAHATGWQAHAGTALIGALAVLALLAARRWLRGLAAKLAPLAVLVGSAALLLAAGQALGPVAQIGTLPPLSFTATLPLLDLQLWRALLPSALSIALVAFVSNLVVAQSLGRRAGLAVDPRAEMRGLGAANLAAAFSAGMPVAASFSRSVLLADAGVRSRWAGALVGLLIAAASLLLAAPLALLPKAALAATIIVAVLSGLKLAPLRQAWRYSRTEALLMLSVAVVALCRDVGTAIALGVAVSVALLLQRTARPHVALLGRVPGTEHYRHAERYAVELRDDVLGLRIDESLLFTNAGNLADVVLAQLAHCPGARRVLLQMTPVNTIDLSGLQALQDLQQALAARGLGLDLAEVKGPVLDRLRASGWERWFHGRLYLSIHQGMEGRSPDAG